MKMSKIPQCFALGKHKIVSKDFNFQNSTKTKINIINNVLKIRDETISLRTFPIHRFYSVSSLPSLPLLPSPQNKDNDVYFKPVPS